MSSTGKAVTPFGGLASFLAWLGSIGLGAQVSAAMPFGYSSPNAIPAAHTLTAFLTSVLVGASRFAHSGWLRHDRALHAMLGIARFPRVKMQSGASFTSSPKRALRHSGVRSVSGCWALWPNRPTASRWTWIRRSSIGRAARRERSRVTTPDGRAWRGGVPFRVLRAPAGGLEAALCESRQRFF